MLDEGDEPDSIASDQESGAGPSPPAGPEPKLKPDDYQNFFRRMMQNLMKPSLRRKVKKLEEEQGLSITPLSKKEVEAMQALAVKFMKLLKDQEKKVREQPNNPNNPRYSLNKDQLNTFQAQVLNPALLAMSCKPLPGQHKDQEKKEQEKLDQERQEEKKKKQQEQMLQEKQLQEAVQQGKIPGQVQQQGPGLTPQQQIQQQQGKMQQQQLQQQLLKQEQTQELAQKLQKDMAAAGNQPNDDEEDEEQDKDEEGEDELDTEDATDMLDTLKEAFDGPEFNQLTSEFTGMDAAPGGESAQLGEELGAHAGAIATSSAPMLLVGS